MRSDTAGSTSDSFGTSAADDATAMPAPTTGWPSAAADHTAAVHPFDRTGASAPG